MCTNPFFSVRGPISQMRLRKVEAEMPHPQPSGLHTG